MTDIQSSLTRYLSGEATPEEVWQVESWIAESAGNHKEFEAQWETMQLASPGGNYKQPDITREWNALQNQLARPGNTIVKNSFNQKKIIYGIAALVISATILFLLLKPGREKQTGIQNYSSNDKTMRHTFTNGGVFFLDKHSSISRTIENTKQATIGLKGNVYFTQHGHQDSLPSFKLGELEVIPGNNPAIYLSFDSATNTSMVQVDQGTALLKANAEELMLAPGESVTYNGHTKTIGNKQPSNPNLYSYATFIFNFNDTPLPEAAGYLEKAYGVTIQLKQPAMKKCRITTRFDNKSINEILDVMAYTLNFEYSEAEKSKFLVSGKGCE